MVESGLTDKELMTMLGIALFVTQIVYFLISKSSTSKVIDKLVELMEGLNPHFKRVERTEKIVEQLKEYHNHQTIKNKEMLASLLEISKILLETALIHREMRQEVLSTHNKFESMVTRHSDKCKDQFATIDKKFDKVIERLKEKK